MGERGMGIKTDDVKHKWEQEDFPQLCETCLGENPYVRMIKESFGKACKICERPFTVFRWKPGQKARYKKTEICQTCAKIKNVCQTCILDLQYGLPVQVRDTFLASESAASTALTESNGVMSNANRSWYSQQHMAQLAQDGAVSAYGKAAPNQSLVKLARKDPFYARNRPHLCSFYARGECSRGESCPYLHEMPKAKDDPLSKQNITDRYNGRNDPVAKKIIQKHEEKQSKPKLPAVPPPPPAGMPPPLPPGPPPLPSSSNGFEAGEPAPPLPKEP